MVLSISLHALSLHVSSTLNAEGEGGEVAVGAMGVSAGVNVGLGMDGRCRLGSEEEQRRKGRKAYPRRVHPLPLLVMAASPVVDFSSTEDGPGSDPGAGVGS